MEILAILWNLWLGAIIWIVIKHFLDRSTLASERIYQYQKEELLRYRQISEKVIEKLILLNHYREWFQIYLKLSYDASRQAWARFIDLNDSLNKSDFEKNKEQIATIIFLYFHELGEDWNNCLEGISQIATIIHKIELSEHTLNDNEWQSAINEFNQLNQLLGDKPLELSKNIKNTILEMEKSIIKQKPRFYFS